MAVDEDTAVYATKPIALLSPLASPQIAARSFCIRRFPKPLANGSVLIVFDSDAPSVKPDKHIAKSNEVKARMRGGFWISPVAPTNIGNKLAASQSPAFAEQSSIVTMFLQVDAKGWVGAGSMFGSTMHLESYLTEHVNVRGRIRNFVENQIHASGAPLCAPSNADKATVSSTSTVGPLHCNRVDIGQASDTVANKRDHSFPFCWYLCRDNHCQ